MRNKSNRVHTFITIKMKDYICKRITHSQLRTQLIQIQITTKNQIFQPY